MENKVINIEVKGLTSFVSQVDTADKKFKDFNGNLAKELGVSEQALKGNEREVKKLYSSLEKYKQVAGATEKTNAKLERSFTKKAASIAKTARRLDATKFEGAIKAVKGLDGSVSGVTDGLADVAQMIPGWGQALSVGLRIAGPALDYLIGKWNETSDAFAEYEREAASVKKITDRLLPSLQKEIGELDKLFGQIVRTNVAQEDRIKALDTLKEKYPEHLANLDLENTSLTELAAAYSNLTNVAIEESIKRFEAEQRLANQQKLFNIEFNRSLIEENLKATREQIKNLEKVGGYTGDLYNDVYKYQNALSNANKEIKEFNKSNLSMEAALRRAGAALRGEFSSNSDTFSSITRQVTGLTGNFKIDLSGGNKGGKKVADALNKGTSVKVKADLTLDYDEDVKTNLDDLGDPLLTDEEFNKYLKRIRKAQQERRKVADEDSQKGLAALDSKLKDNLDAQEKAQQDINDAKNSAVKTSELQLELQEKILEVENKRASGVQAFKKFEELSTDANIIKSVTQFSSTTPMDLSKGQLGVVDIGGLQFNFGDGQTSGYVSAALQKVVDKTRQQVQKDVNITQIEIAELLVKNIEAVGLGFSRADAGDISGPSPIEILSGSIQDNSAEINKRIAALKKEYQERIAIAKAAGQDTSLLEEKLRALKDEEKQIRRNQALSEQAKRVAEEEAKENQKISELEQKRAEAKQKAADQLSKTVDLTNKQLIEAASKFMPDLSLKMAELDARQQKGFEDMMTNIGKQVEEANKSLGATVFTLAEDGTVTVLSDEFSKAGDRLGYELVQSISDNLTGSVSNIQGIFDVLVKEIDKERSTAERDIAKAILSMTEKDLEAVTDDIRTELDLSRWSIDWLTEEFSQFDKLAADLGIKGKDLVEHRRKFLNDLLKEETAYYQRSQELIKLPFEIAIARVEATGGDAEYLRKQLEVELNALELQYFKFYNSITAAQEANSKSVRKTLQEILKDIIPVLQAAQGLGDELFNFFTVLGENALDLVNDQLSEVDERINESASRLQELQSDLGEKESGRRDAVLAAIEREKEREKQLADEKLKLTKRQEQEEKKLAAIRKAQAISQAIISGALAQLNIWATVPKADFGVTTGILSGIAAAVTATQLATIAAQQFATGGFTGDGTFTDSTGHKVAGVVHNDEWVAPKWMVESPKFAPAIQQLESARTRGFADGGFTSSVSGSVDNGLKSQRMMNEFVNASIALANRPIYANAVEFSNVSNNYNRKMRATTIGG